MYPIGAGGGDVDALGGGPVLPEVAGVAGTCIEGGGGPLAEGDVRAEVDGGARWIDLDGEVAGALAAGRCLDDGEHHSAGVAKGKRDRGISSGNDLSIARDLEAEGAAPCAGTGLFVHNALRVGTDRVWASHLRSSDGKVALVKCGEAEFGIVDEGLAIHVKIAGSAQGIGVVDHAEEEGRCHLPTQIDFAIWRQLKVTPLLALAVDGGHGGDDGGRRTCGHVVLAQQCKGAVGFPSSRYIEA